MSFCQFGSDDFQIALRHSWGHAEPRKKEFVNIGQSYGYQFVKDHEEEGGRHGGEPGDHEGVGILEKFLFYVVWQSPTSA